MKIAIPTNENSINSEICPSFGRSPFFCIFDTETQKSTFLENPAADATGGAGVKAAQCIVDSGAEVVLTPRCGENAAQVLQPASIAIFKTKALTAKENLDAFLNNDLAVLDHFHAGFHGRSS